MNLKITRNDKKFLTLLKHLYEMQNITGEILYPYLITNYKELIDKTGFKFRNIKRIITKLEKAALIELDIDHIYHKGKIIRNQLFITI